MTASSPSLSPTLELACELIRRPSVTPLDADCQALMMRRLEAAGFALEPMRIEEVDNFWARRGGDGPVLCFAGHTDVVPTGPLQAWQRHQPFDALIDDRGMLCGRGAADMKGSLASMIVAVERFVADHPAQGCHRLPHHQRRGRPGPPAPRRWSNASPHAASAWTGASSANRRAPAWSATW